MASPTAISQHPWFFYGSRENFDRASKKGMLAIDMGVFDPITGKTNAEIAAMSRSQHKSQGFGSAPSFWRTN